ncbi:MAG: DUF190 domain-containing protein [Alphaproteobacteria bacterium]|nr:DUF190 domain-containing protein [Alphaproteobacteria bacterium]
MDLNNLVKKKQLSFYIELPFLKRFLRVLDDQQITGYTVFQAIAGSGTSGAWRTDSLSSDAGRICLIQIILDDELLPKVLNVMEDVLRGQADMISISEVMCAASSED